MKIKIFIVIVLYLIIVFTEAAGEFKKTKNKKANNMEDSSKVEYRINDKIVTEEEFINFLNTLTEVQGTWFCAETKKGGMTGYDAKDKDGIIYEYRANSEPGNNKSTITKKGMLK